MKIVVKLKTFNQVDKEDQIDQAEEDLQDKMVEYHKAKERMADVTIKMAVSRHLENLVKNVMVKIRMRILKDYQDLATVINLYFIKS